MAKNVKVGTLTMSDTEYISKDAFITQQRKQYCVNCERRKGTKNGKRIFVYEIGEAPCRACDIEDMIDAVDDFLPADVAPVVRGHWKRKSRRFINKETGAVQAHYIWNECSLCRKHNQCKTDFCPHCGAEMDESEE